MVKYIYDAWGNHKVLNADDTENTDATFIGNINPIQGNRPMTHGEKKAFKKLLKEIIKALTPWM